MLTDAKLRTAPGKKDKIEVISEAQGLNVRLSISGSITFFYRDRGNGKAAQPPTGDNPTVSLFHALEHREAFRVGLTGGFAPR